jgi:hypothetical protein
MQVAEEENDQAMDAWEMSTSFTYHNQVLQLLWLLSVHQARLEAALRVVSSLQVPPSLPAAWPCWRLLVDSLQPQNSHQMQTGQQSAPKFPEPAGALTASMGMYAMRLLC